MNIEYQKPGVIVGYVGDSVTDVDRPGLARRVVVTQKTRRARFRDIDDLEAAAVACQKKAVANNFRRVCQTAGRKIADMARIARVLDIEDLQAVIIVRDIADT